MEITGYFLDLLQVYFNFTKGNAKEEKLKTRRYGGKGRKEGGEGSQLYEARRGEGKKGRRRRRLGSGSYAMRHIPQSWCRFLTEGPKQMP